MAKMRISPELKKLIEKYRCVKDTEGMSPAKVYKLVGENENLYLKMTDSRYKGTTYDVEREKDMMLWLEGKLPVPKVLHFERHDGWSNLLMSEADVFDFIPFREDMLERDIEQALVRDVTKLLLELGTGFAFLGNQYHLNVGGDDFYIDLLFYNLNLRCYVVIELKTGEFKPEYAGQLNFYLSAVDGILKKEQDNPSIGLLLCKSKNNVVAEYSLKDISKPIGVSEYKVTSSLPVDLEKQLPSVEDIQKRIK